MAGIPLAAALAAKTALHPQILQFLPKNWLAELAMTVVHPNGRKEAADLKNLPDKAYFCNVKAEDVLSASTLCKSWTGRSTPVEKI